jgi:hypothetical protein
MADLKNLPPDSEVQIELGKMQQMKSCCQRYEAGRVDRVAWAGLSVLKSHFAQSLGSETRGISTL